MKPHEKNYEKSCRGMKFFDYSKKPIKIIYENEDLCFLNKSIIIKVLCAVLIVILLPYYFFCCAVEGFFKGIKDGYKSLFDCVKKKKNN